MTTVDEYNWRLPRDLSQRARIRWPAEYGWAPSEKWLEPVRAGLSHHLEVERTSEIVVPKYAALVFELHLDGATHSVAIDYSDYPQINEEIAAASLCYFKMQFRNAGYGHPDVLPGGFVTNELAIYRLLPWLRRQRAKPARGDVYGRFGMRYATETRRQALELLENQTRFQFIGSPKILRYKRYLREAARAKVCLDLPGNGDLCFRLIDYLAMGCCVISPVQNSRLHVPLENGKHIVYVQQDFSDLVDRCEEVLDDEEFRSAISANASDFFDRSLHHNQLAAYYLHECLSRIE